MQKINANKSRYSKNINKRNSNGNLEQDSELDEYSEEEDYNEEYEKGVDELEQDEIPPIEEPKKINPHKHNNFFQNVWWKKGIIKGFTLWILFVILFYVFEFLGMVDVIDWKRWLFFLLFLLIIGLAYEKFYLNRLLP
jgi:hypothetical protein